MAAIIAVHLWASPLRGQSTDDDPHATGLRPPTAEDLAWMDQNMQDTKAVRLNELGLKRINIERRAKLLQELANASVVPVGEEPLARAASMAQAGAEEGDAAVAAAEASLPSAVDNSKLPSFPEVRTQGELNSCAAFSTTYYVGTHETGLARGWTNRVGDNTRKFSPKLAYNLVNGGIHQGTYFSPVFDVLLKLGAATWSDWPYSEVAAPKNYLEWPRSATVWRHAIDYRFREVGRIRGIDTDAGRTLAKRMLNNGHLLLYATQSPNQAWRFGTLSNDPATNADDKLVGQHVCRYVQSVGTGHAMTIVGYDDDVWTDINKNGRVDSGEKGAFKVVNSWGTSWQDDGFAWIAYDALRRTSQVAAATATDFRGNRSAAFWNNEVYWITARDSYTPTLLAQFTLSHASRGQLGLRLGRSATSATKPSLYWPERTSYSDSDGDWANGQNVDGEWPQIFQNLGGALGFDGSASAVPGTFVFDCTDLAANGTQRYYLEVADGAVGARASASEFKLLSPDGSTVATASSGIPLSADNTTAYAYVDYTMGSSSTVPSITSATSATAVVGQTFSYTITASNNPTGFTASGLPSGLVLNASTGVVSGAPTQTGNYTVSLSASNASGTGRASLALSVTAPPRPTPSITSATTAGGTVGTPFTYTITATNNPTSFGATNLPAGLSLDPDTGVISGTPTRSGTATVTLSANNYGGTGTLRLALTIRAAIVGAPRITSSNSATGVSGSNFTYRITALYNPTRFGASDLPSGLTLDTSTGVITGILPAARPYTITLSAGNSYGTGYLTLTLLVTGGGSFGPANDAFSDGIPLTGATVAVTGSNINGTAEAGEPAHAGAVASKSIWWVWTAPSDGTLVLDTNGSNFDTVLAVYTGSAVSALTLVASDDQGGTNGASRLTANVTVGTVYRIAVDGRAAAEGSVCLNLAFSARNKPSNDAFVNRSVVSGTAVAAVGGNLGATAEAGEPAHAGNAAAKSVWWTWTAPQSGRVSIDTNGSSFDTVLAVYTGSAVNALTLIASSDQGGLGNASKVTFEAVAGIVYQIAVDGWKGADGSICLGIAFCGAAPLNDDFANRASFTGASAGGSNIGATAESDEPDHAGKGATKSVWWTWTAPQSGRVSIDTIGSDFDTLLAIYTGGGLSSLTRVASDDDSADGGCSIASFNVTAGMIYQIAVDGWNGGEGNVKLNVAFASPVPPSNDAFAKRGLLAGGNVSAKVLNLYATAETGEPAHAGNTAAKSVWWMWTAPQSGRVTLSTSGSDFDTVLAVYTGTAVDKLTAIAADDDNGAGTTSSVVFFAAAGTTYVFAVDGYDGAGGQVVLSLALVQSSELYFTDFENFPSGSGKVAGSDGWLSSSDEDGTSGIYDAFVGGGKAAWLGYKATAESTVLVGRFINYSPVAAGTPRIRFQVDLGVKDSTNANRDKFAFTLFNLSEELICSLVFDNDNQRIYRSDGSRMEVVGEFARDHRYALDVTFDFATNLWSASLGTTLLFTNKPMSANAGRSLSLGLITASWLVKTTGSSGDNYLVFDNYRISLGGGGLGPVVTAQPTSKTTMSGAAVVFSVTATSSAGLSYQWQRSTDGGTSWANLSNGAIYAGTTTATLTVIPPGRAYSGTQYRCVISDGVNPLVTTQAATLTVGWSQFAALSARAPAGTGEQTLILGFVFAGGGKPTLVRGVGPNMSATVSGYMRDPQLTLYTAGGSEVARNDNWGGTNALSTAFAQTGAGPLVANSKDAALLEPLTGNVYTAHVSGVNGTTGVALAEAFDADLSDKTKRLTALSVRNQVGIDENIIIAGFVIVGDAPKRVIVRGVGPGMAATVSSYLRDPYLQVWKYDIAAKKWDMVGENDNWDHTAETAALFASVGMSPPLGSDSTDAALVLTLEPGIYTAQVSGVGNTTGVGLAEIYEAP